jgi:hypothetical protein
MTAFLDKCQISSIKTMVVDLILALRNLSLQLPLRQQRKKELSSTPLSVKKILVYFPQGLTVIKYDLHLVQ